MKDKIRIDCAKGGCREEAKEVCPACTFAFCKPHVSDHQHKGGCSIQ